MKRIPQFMIAAPTSGSGKTTISVGIMELLTQKGYKVQPFKCGPDYIDTMFHRNACGRPSINLDTFLASDNHVKDLYRLYGKDADICVVEGMMGMYDGFSRWEGSSAYIASLLDIPVLLIADAKSTSYSMAPLLKGFMTFSDKVRIMGVIFNKVGSLRHKAMLEEVCDDLGIKALGFIPSDRKIKNESRYLGLDFSKMTQKEDIAKLVAKHVNIDKLLLLASSPLDDTSFTIKPDNRKVLIAANREAFSFIYNEHLAKWPNASFFTPDIDEEIDSDIDLLYLPGGYPEKYLQILSSCKKRRESIKRYADAGGKILAECGGMAYLCRSIINDRAEYEMCGVLPYSVSSKKADCKLSLGYRSLTLNGMKLRGHEFHYTHFKDAEPETVTQVFDAKGNKIPTQVIRVNNTIASYTHLYWGEQDIFNIF